MYERWFRCGACYACNVFFFNSSRTSVPVCCVSAQRSTNSDTGTSIAEQKKIGRYTNVSDVSVRGIKLSGGTCEPLVRVCAL